MLRSGLFVVVVIALARIATGADHPVPRTPHPPPPAIVLIPADSTADHDSPLGFSLLLRQSLANHLGFLLADGDRAANLRTTAAPVSPAEALASLPATSGQEALLLYYAAELRDEPFTARDRHRRRYHAVAANCLNLDLHYERFRLSSAGWTDIDRGSVTAVGEPVRIAIRTGSGEIYCEPHEFVIQRALNALAGQIPGIPVESPQPTRILPVRIYLSQPVAYGLSQTPEQLEQVLAFASRQLVEQFGLRLVVVAVDTLPSYFGNRRSLQESQAELDAAFPAAGDTLMIVFTRLLEPKRFTTGERRDEIGLSRLGQRRIYMDLIPPADSDGTLWATIANGLTLLHEFGHAFGGIHVSDINSVMNHEANWVNAAAFDPLNAKLIAAALDGTLRFDDPAEYLRFFTQALLSTPYYLADFPAFLNDYLSWGGNRRISERLRAAIGNTTLLNAADAVELLARRQYHLAARKLRAAVREQPQQASLYYYLSLSVDHRSAASLRATARRLGYLMAAGQ